MTEVLSPVPAGATAPLGRHDLQQRLIDADLLLRYLSEHGVTNPKSPSYAVGAPPDWAVKAIGALRASLAVGAVTHDQEADFIRAVAYHAHAARPASIDGVRAKYARGGRRHFLSFMVFSGVLFLALAFFYTCVLSLTNTLKEIDAQNAAINQLAQEGFVARAQADCDKLTGVNYNTNLIKAKSEISHQTVVWLSRILLLDQLPKQQVTVEIYAVEQERVKSPPVCEPKPKSPEEAARAAAATRVATAAAIKEYGPLACVPDKVDCGLDEAEGLGRRLLQIFGTIILPMLFGAAGSAVYALRRGVTQLEECTFTNDSARRYWIRTGLGMFFGPFIGLLLDPAAGTSLSAVMSPFALSFVAGYSVEGVFALLDKATNFLRRQGRDETTDEHGQAPAPRPPAHVGTGARMHRLAGAKMRQAA